MAKRYSHVIRKLTIALVTILVAMACTINANAANMVDVSNWQYGINVTTTGADVIVAKATEGTRYVNRDCDRVVQSALNSGKGAGVYHFAHTYDDPTQEANHFLANTRKYIGKGVVPILDWEPEDPGNTAWAEVWLDRVEKAWGAKPVLYMNQGTENRFNWKPLVKKDYGLWIAAYPLGYTPIYGFNPPAKQPLLKNWDFAVAWQYTSSGRIDGWNGPLDLTVIYGSLDTWRAYAGTMTSKPVPPAPAPAPVRPQKPSPRPVPSGVGKCVVSRRGDSLSAIASRMGVNWQSLTGYRSGNPNLIYPGETICSGKAQPRPSGHVVKRGESLWTIYGAGWPSAAARNGLRAPYTIYPGQVLR